MPIQDSSAKFPRTRYALRLLEKTFKISGKGNPMLACVWEVSSPAEVRIGTDMYAAAGIQCRNWMMLDEKSRPNTIKMLGKLGINIPEIAEGEITEETPIDWSPLEGLCVQAMCGSKLKVIEEESYNEEGKLVRTPIVEDGKPLTTFEFDFQLRDVLKRVNADGTAY